MSTTRTRFRQHLRAIIRPFAATPVEQLPTWKRWRLSLVMSTCLEIIDKSRSDSSGVRRTYCTARDPKWSIYIVPPRYDNILITTPHTVNTNQLLSRTRLGACWNQRFSAFSRGRSRPCSRGTARSLWDRTPRPLATSLASEILHQGAPAWHTSIAVTDFRRRLDAC